MEAQLGQIQARDIEKSTVEKQVSSGSVLGVEAVSCQVDAFIFKRKRQISPPDKITCFLSSTSIRCAGAGSANHSSE